MLNVYCCRCDVPQLFYLHFHVIICIITIIVICNNRNIIKLLILHKKPFYFYVLSFMLHNYIINRRTCLNIAICTEIFSFSLHNLSNPLVMWKSCHDHTKQLSHFSFRKYAVYQMSTPIFSCRLHHYHNQTPKSLVHIIMSLFFFVHTIKRIIISLKLNSML